MRGAKHWKGEPSTPHTRAPPTPLKGTPEEDDMSPITVGATKVVSFGHMKGFERISTDAASVTLPASGGGVVMGSPKVTLR